MQTVQLSSAVRLCIRPGPAIQFGVDARRAGVFTALAPDAVKGVVLALLTARHPVPVRTVIVGLTTAGLSDIGAQSLLEDLISYRILRVLPRSLAVAVWGSGLLAQRITTMLREYGVEVRLRVPGEQDAAFLARLRGDPTMPVVVVDQLAEAARELGHADMQTWVPVTLLDGRGQLGPLHIGGVGACPMCLELQRAAGDPSWCTLDAWEPIPAPDPVALTATVAHVVACVLALLDCKTAPPGTTLMQYHPGALLEIDPYASTPRSTVVQPHASCPVCWDCRHG